MIMHLRLLPALAVLAAGFVTLDALRKRTQKRAAQADLSQDLKTWEGEGGNLPPSAPAAGAA